MRLFFEYALSIAGASLLFLSLALFAYAQSGIEQQLERQKQIEAERQPMLDLLTEVTRLAADDAETKQQQAEAIEQLRQQVTPLNDQLLRLQKEQVNTLFTEQQSISGVRPVTVVASPATDYSGYFATNLSEPLRQLGHDVIVVPDSADYTTQLDRVISEINILPTDVAVNCVGWGKGAVGCMALATRAATEARQLTDVVLLDPDLSLGESNIANFTISDLATTNIALETDGKVTLIVPKRESAYAVYRDLGGRIAVTDVEEVTSMHGTLSLGLDATTVGQVVTLIASGQTAGTETGALLNIAGNPPTGESVASEASGNGGWWQQTVAFFARLFGFGDRQRASTDGAITPDTYLRHIVYVADRPGWNESQHVALARFTTNQALGFDILSAPNAEVDGDLGVLALRADSTLGDEYRFRGALRYVPASDAQYSAPDITNELSLDLNCDGTVDGSKEFVTPDYTLRAESGGADIILSEYLPVPIDGLHCFSFFVDTSNEIAEINERNNFSEWREFIVGFNEVVATSGSSLPPLNFEVSAYTAEYESTVRPWTNEDIVIVDDQQVAFRWDAPSYETCTPLLSFLTPEVAGNFTPIERNTLTENTDVHEHTGYYELRCSIGETTVVESIHITVQ